MATPTTKRRIILPPLVGTLKQVSFGEQIRRGCILRTVNNPSACPSSFRKDLETAIAGLPVDAHWWITHQENGDEFVKLALNVLLSFRGKK